MFVFYDHPCFPVSGFCYHWVTGFDFDKIDVVFVAYTCIVSLPIHLIKKTLKSKYCWNIAWFNDTPLDVAVCKQIPNSVKAKSWNTQLSLAVKLAITVVQMVVCTRGATYRQERRHSVHSFPVFYLVYTSTPTSGSCGGPCFVRADSVVLMHGGRGSSKVVSGNNAAQVCWSVCGGVGRSGFYYPFEPGLFVSEKWRGMLIESLFIIIIVIIIKESEPGCLIVRIIFVLCVIAPVRRDRREELAHVVVQWAPGRVFKFAWSLTVHCSLALSYSCSVFLFLPLSCLLSVIPLSEESL